MSDASGEPSTPFATAPGASASPPRSPREGASLRCVRCGREFAPDRNEFDCPVCRSSVPANLEFVSPAGRHRGDALRAAWESRPRGVWRYEELLPVPAAQAISLGEGGTPLVACPRIGEDVGLPLLMAKNESCNPTWSFKDRLASVAVSWARATGRPGVAASSSGNAGAAIAAYAARAGLPCIIFTTRAYPGTMQRFMRGYGAMVVAAPTAPDRWVLNRAVAKEWGWLPISNVTDPPVGSHPAGVEGHKTIAYEIAQDLGWTAPDAVVVPVAYGDSMAGIWKGFQELHTLGLIDRLPRMIAAETYGSLQRALATDAAGPVETGGTGSFAYSAAAPRGTYQALRALRESGGVAVAVSDEEIGAARRQMATAEGLLVELSAAMPLAAARKLAAAGVLREHERVVLLVTSSGVKDLEVGATSDELPLVEPTLDALKAVLKERFAYDG